MRRYNLTLQIEKPQLRELVRLSIFTSVHGPAKMHFTVDDLAFSVAGPFSIGLSYFTQEN